MLVGGKNFHVSESHVQKLGYRQKERGGGEWAVEQKQWIFGGGVCVYVRSRLVGCDPLAGRFEDAHPP